MNMLARTVPTLLTLAALSRAQFPPTPSDVTTVDSKYEKGVTISYKEVSLNFV